MNNEDFIMLRSLNKEDYQEGESPLWKVRKNKWDYNPKKTLEAIDICDSLYKKGLAERKSIICGICGKFHSDKYNYKITNKGIGLLSIPQKIARNKKTSLFSKWINKILKNKASSKSNNNKSN